MMKRILSLVLCAAMLLALAACGAEKPDTSKPTQESKASEGDTTGDDTAEGAETSQEPIRFSIFHPDYGRKIPPDDAPIIQQLFEKTGVMFDWIIPPAEPMERLNIMLATDDLPDIICFSGGESTMMQTVMGQFIEAGKLLDLEDLMKEHAPMAYEVNYASFRDRIRYKDDKMYYLPGEYQFGDAADTRFFPETDYGYTARTGLIEELGWNVTDTLDDVFKLLEASKESQPDMAPLALALGPQGHLSTLTGIGAGAYGLIYEDSDILLIDGEVKYFSDVPELKEWYSYLNKIHRAGLLDVESSVMSADMLKEKLVAGKIFSWFGPGWEAGSEFIAYMESIDSDEQASWYLFPKANDSIEKTTFARYQEGLYATGLALTKNNKDPGRFLEFYEYINTEEGWFAANGITNWDFTGENTVEATEGYDWVVRNDKEPLRPGMPLIEASAWMGESWNNDENWYWNRGVENFQDFLYMAGNHPNGKYDQVGDYDVGMWWDENTTRINAELGWTGLNYWERMTDVGGDNTLIYNLTLESSSDEAVAQVTMEEYLKTQLPRIIVANTEEEFEQLWSDMDKQLENSGKDIFVAKKTELYKERLVDWGIE